MMAQSLRTSEGFVGVRERGISEYLEVMCWIFWRVTGFL